MSWSVAAVLLLCACTAPARVAGSVGSSTPSLSSKPSPRKVEVDPSRAATWPVPDPKFTPGYVLAGCTYPRPAADRNVLPSTKALVSREYGITLTGIASGEFDHLIPYSLCGGDGALNIWPELYDGAKPSMFIHNHKDSLEAFAARQVRYKRWTLQFAQSVFKSDWRVAWCKYVKTAAVDCAGL